MRYEQILDELGKLSDEYREDFQLELYDLVAEDTDLEERSRDEFNLDGLEIFEHFYIDIPDEAVVELEGENRIDREYLETEIGEHVRLASFENFLEYVPLLKRKVDDAKLGTYGSFEEKSIRPDKNKKKPIRNTLKDFVNKQSKNSKNMPEKHRCYK